MGAYLNGVKISGDGGSVASISVGSTNTGSVGSNATVTNSGTSDAAVLNFTIPKGAKGDKGDPGTNGTNGTVPTITMKKGTYFDSVGTPTVTASTSGTTTTLTFDYMKGATGDKGTNGTNGTTPTIKVTGGTNIASSGTPSVSRSVSGTTATYTFNYLKGATGAKGAKGDTGDNGSTSTVTIVNNLTSTSTTSVLSANQGKVLNDGKVPTTRTIAGKALSADITAAELAAAIQTDIGKALYPVGSIYISTKNTNPGTSLGFGT